MIQKCCCSSITGLTKVHLQPAITQNIYDNPKALMMFWKFRQLTGTLVFTVACSAQNPAQSLWLFLSKPNLSVCCDGELGRGSTQPGWGMVSWPQTGLKYWEYLAVSGR